MPKSTGCKDPKVEAKCKGHVCSSACLSMTATKVLDQFYLNSIREAFTRSCRIISTFSNNGPRRSPLHFMSQMRPSSIKISVTFCTREFSITLRSRVLTAVTMNSDVYYDVTPCSLVVRRRFGETHYHHFHSRRVSKASGK
jgi:hypothetical protein